MMSCWKICFISLFALHYCQANSGHDKVDSKYNVYDVFGRDFQNTQTSKWCLLARLNASFLLKYRPTNFQQEVFLPAYATNHNSQCDYNFFSVLTLEFDSVIFELHFKRDKTASSPTQRSYCDHCDNGNWRLDEIKITINDTNMLHPGFPSTRLVTDAIGKELPEEAGGLIATVGVSRGYVCSDHTLSATLQIRNVTDHIFGYNNRDEWNVEVTFYAVEVQPFLVTSRTIRDPLLCKDVTVFIVLIIVIPLVYFFFFIVLCRVKDRYGCPPKWNKKIILGELDEKSLVDKKFRASSDSKPALASASVKSTNGISITCTAPEESC